MNSEVELFANVIWEGRFQPIHRGHVEVVQRLLEHGKRVWIWVVANETSSEVFEHSELSPVPEFTQAVDPHHVAEKNPIPFWLRYRLVVETLIHELGADAPVTVCGGRRLDLAWDLYIKILPPDRVFLTPLRDEFEDAKAEAWRSLGERCLRIDVSDLAPISATQVRERFRSGKTIDDLLSLKTIEILKEEGYLDRLRQV